MNRPEMMPCDQVIARLWEYIDGELTPDSADRVREHLEICSRCFPQYDFQRAYKEFALRGAAQPVPPQLRRRVFEMILREEAAASTARGGLGGRIGASLRRVLRRDR
jgi:anti-sigma factor (TIGR02949 family)